MKTALFTLVLSTALLSLSTTAKAQVDDMCREFGVTPSFDQPSAQVPYLYGRVVLKGFASNLKPKVTVIFGDAGNPSKRINLGSTGGTYCFRRSGGGGNVIVEVDGVEAARRTLTGFGATQQREDFEIYPASSQTPQPASTVSAKFSYPRNEKTVGLYQRASEAEKNNEVAKAIDLMKEIVEIDPPDFIAWSILGSLYLENKSYAESDAAVRKSLGLRVDYTPAWVNVGRLRLAQKQPEAAIELFKHAVSLEPTSARTYKFLGETYLQTKQGTLAVEALNEAIKLDRIGMAECHLLLARLYDAAGAKKLAAREFKLFLGKVPDYADKAKLEKYIKDNPQ
jgi:Flp pilus assembly protein TadD